MIYRVTVTDDKGNRVSFGYARKEHAERAAVTEEQWMDAALAAMWGVPAVVSVVREWQS